MENSKVIPSTGGATPFKYPVKLRLTINKYLADSHEETIALKIDPEIRAANIIPIPAAVLRIKTEIINESVPTTTATNQTSPKSIKINFHWLIILTFVVSRTPFSAVNPVMMGALIPLKPNTNPEMINESIPTIAKIIEIENRSVIYLLRRIFQRLTGRVSNNFIEPNECSEDTKSLAMTITRSGISIGPAFSINTLTKVGAPGSDGLISWSR